MKPSELKNKKKRQLTDEEKMKINKELIQSQGILRDYDINELLYPLSPTLLDTLGRMREYAQSTL